MPARSITPQLLRRTQGRRRAPETDNLLHRARLLERERERTTDQTGPENNKFAELRHLERLLQRLQEARIFGLFADRDAQPLRQAVAADRTHNNTLLEQFLVYTGTIADLEGHEITVRDDVLKPQLVQRSDDLAMPRWFSS